MIVWLTCTGHVDYEFRPYTLRFIESVTRISLKISIFDDDVFEGNENFNLTIDASELHDNVMVTYPSEVVVIISDSNDGM